MSGDPSWSSVVLLAINENGADGSTTFTDASASANALTAVGNFQWDTADAPTGLTSSGLSDATGDYLTAGDAAAFGLASGDHTVEFFWKYVSNAGTQVLVDIRNGVGGPNGGLIYSNGANLLYHENGSTRISGAIPAAGSWRHFAVSRSGSSTKAFLAGTQFGSTYTATNALGNSAALFIGISKDGGSTDLNGWIASVRITKGVARYTADFTPPSLPLPTSAGVSMPMPLMRQMVH